MLYKIYERKTLTELAGFEIPPENRVVLMIHPGTNNAGDENYAHLMNALRTSPDLAEEVSQIQEVEITGLLVLSFDVAHLSRAKELFWKLKHLFPEISAGINVGPVSVGSFRNPSSQTQQRVVYEKTVVEAAILTSLGHETGGAIYVHQNATALLEKHLLSSNS